MQYATRVHDEKFNLKICYMHLIRHNISHREYMYMVKVSYKYYFLKKKVHKEHETDMKNITDGI